MAVEKSSMMRYDALLEEAIQLQKQLQELLSCGKFLLRKWNCSDPAVLDNVPSELARGTEHHQFTSKNEDSRFRISISIWHLPSLDSVTKR